MTTDVYRRGRERVAELQFKSRGFSEWVPWTEAQTAPPGDWEGWLFLAGRGTGKTDAGSNYVKSHVEGPACLKGPEPHRIRIVAPTLEDAREACIVGETGILRHDPTAVQYAGSYVKWPNGSRARSFGAYNRKDVDRLRAGGNSCLDWYEELAAWPQLVAAFEQAAYGLRSGSRPHWIATTTGKPRKLLLDLLSYPSVVKTTASTADNPHLPDHIKRNLVTRYEGTRRGRQELHGEIVMDVEGAIWSTDEIEEHRHPPVPVFSDFLETLDSIVVAVDPPGGATEAGIVAAGRRTVAGVDQFYPLADRSLKDTPHQWGTTVINLFHELKADAVIVEKNYGGDMVKALLNQIDPHVPVKEVTATRGKKVRAEPVHDLYEQGRVHHVGRLERLEEEMTTWVPESSPDEVAPSADDDDDFEKSRWSPNRLDALVWGITYLAGFNEPQLWFA